MEKPYNFLGMIDKVYALFKNALDYSAGKSDILGFLLFITLIVAGLPLLGFITTPLIILAAIEYFLFETMDYLDERVGDDNPLVHSMAVFGIILMFVPTITFFGPAMIWGEIKKRKEKRMEEYERTYMEQAQQWVRNYYISPTRRVEKDFKPRKYLTPYNFGGRYVILRPGDYVNSQSETIRATHIEGGMTPGQAYVTGYYNIAIGNNIIDYDE